MNPTVKKYWAEISAAAVAVYFFLLPSLQAWAAAHPKSTVSALIAAAVAMGLKKSPLAE
jgi:hypothetical protein